MKYILLVSLFLATYLTANAQCRILFILDDSGSINGGERIDLQASCQNLANELINLSPGVEIAEVQYSYNYANNFPGGPENYLVRFGYTSTPTIVTDDLAPGAAGDFLPSTLYSMQADGIFDPGNTLDGTDAIFIFTDGYLNSSPNSSYGSVLSGPGVGGTAQPGLQQYATLSAYLGGIPISIYRVANSSMGSISGAEQGGGTLYDFQTTFNIPPAAITTIAQSVLSSNVDAGPDVDVCDDGSMVTLTASGASSYSWDNGVIDGVPFTPLPGTTTYTVTATSSLNGCVNSDQVDVTLIPPPVIDAGTDVIVCDNSQVTLSGSGGVSYVWDNGITDGVPFLPVPGTTAYVVTGTDANGCVGTDTVNVSVDTSPVVDAGPDVVVCNNGTPVTLYGSGAVTYVWDNGITDSVPFVPTVVGTTTYTVTGTSLNGCTADDQVDVTVMPAPPVDAGTDIVLCGDTLQITLNASGASSYTWDNGVVDGIPFLPPLGNTIYTVSATDANGCTNTDQVSVDVYPFPFVYAGSDTSLCLTGSTVTLSGSGSLSYVWDNGITDGVPFVPPLGTTTYTVIGTSAGGCTATDQVVVTTFLTPTIDAGPDLIVCDDGSLATLAASGALTYTWDNGITDGVPFLPSAGVTTYTVIGTDIYGCVGTDQVDVTLDPLPSVQFFGDVLEGCSPLTVNFFNTTPGNIVDCIWTIDNTVISDCGMVTYVFENPGLYDVSLTTTNNNGCINDFGIDNYIYVEADPIASFFPSSYYLNSFEPDIHFENTTTGATTYQWSIAGEPFSTADSPDYTFSDNSGGFQVELIAYSPLLCTDTAVVVIQMKEETIYYIPNTFTPDGDEYNNVFVPVFTAGYDIFDFDMYIYNRWGELIFESHDSEIGWDGTYHGEMVQEGTYVWKIRYSTKDDSESHVITGHVNMVR